MPPVLAKTGVNRSPILLKGGTEQVNTAKVIGKVGKFNICCRDEHLTSHAGVVRLKELAQRLGVERLLDEELNVKARERGYGEGAAISGLVYNLILGGTCLSDLEVLPGDKGTQEVLALDAVLAPPTAGECLRKFARGDVRDLQRVTLRLQQQVRRAAKGDDLHDCY